MTLYGGLFTLNLKNSEIFLLCRISSKAGSCFSICNSYLIVNNSTSISFSCTIGTKYRFAHLWFPGLEYFFFYATITFVTFPQMHMQTSEGQMLCTRNISSAMRFAWKYLSIVVWVLLILMHSSNLPELLLKKFCLWETLRLAQNGRHNLYPIVHTSHSLCTQFSCSKIKFKHSIRLAFWFCAVFSQRSNFVQLIME